MKLLEQFTIILALTLVVETVKALVPLPIPASIYGLLLMLFLLKAKVIPLVSVKDAGKILLETMPIMFIPAAVGLLNSWNTVKELLFPLIVVIFISTLAVMVISGHVTQMVIHFNQKRSDLKDE
ncbi:CidA/LrgA family protein [Pectinatus haikarae]|uniref:Holin-like protein n=1 Tax=Pectinatus haikarae TaxID=349096 RepID=A0ABT9Y7E4_9FIRM|nr:CidA/LrgA family protein [Pectinatus haikarae]MDQ0203548.1 holin-like protein [Pectinatus haikarae]